MKMTGLHQLFPRVLQYLKDPATSVMDITSPEIDGIVSVYKNCLYIRINSISIIKNSILGMPSSVTV